MSQYKNYLNKRINTVKKNHIDNRLELLDRKSEVLKIVDNMMVF